MAKKLLHVQCTCMPIFIFTVHHAQKYNIDYMPYVSLSFLMLLTYYISDGDIVLAKILFGKRHVWWPGFLTFDDALFLRFWEEDEIM